MHPSTSISISSVVSLVFLDLTFFWITTNVTSDAVPTFVCSCFSFLLLLSSLLFWPSRLLHLLCCCCCRSSLHLHFFLNLVRLCCFPSPSVVTVVVVYLRCKHRLRKWWVVGPAASDAQRYISVCAAKRSPSSSLSSSTFSFCCHGMRVVCKTTRSLVLTLLFCLFSSTAHSRRDRFLSAIRPCDPRPSAQCRGI